MCFLFLYLPPSLPPSLQEDAHVRGYGGHSRKLSNGSSLSPSSILTSLLWPGGNGDHTQEGCGPEGEEEGSGFVGQDNSSDDDDSGVHSRCVTYIHTYIHISEAVPWGHRVHAKFLIGLVIGENEMS